MKALYYRFLLLLLKPFWHLAISIGIIFIVRLAFIGIVHAEDIFQMQGRMSKSEQVFLPAKVHQDYHTHEIMKISETKYVTSKGDIILITPGGFIVNPLKSISLQPIPENTLPLPLHTPKTEPLSFERKLFNFIEENQPIKKYPKYNDYTNILKEYDEILQKVNGKKQLVEKSMELVKNIIPESMLTESATDLKNNKNNNQIALYIANLPYKEVGNLGWMLHLYAVAVMTYNVAHLTQSLENSQLIEEQFIVILKQSFGKKMAEKLLNSSLLQD